MQPTPQPLPPLKQKRPPRPERRRRNPVNDALAFAGEKYALGHVLRLPSSIPNWIGRLFFLGWTTIETEGYLAIADVHAMRDYFGISGTRVHSLYIWRNTGQAEMTISTAIYLHHCGNVIDHIDDDGRNFINLILEYFK